MAHQDDARILLRKPLELFDGNSPGRTNFLSDYTVRANFGNYFKSDEFHSWRFGLGLDKTVLSFSKDALWRFGINLDTIADSKNSINFRIAQTHYEVFTAMEFRVDESVAYFGYRHRCRHAADKTDARIIMKTGPEIGFNGFGRVGPFNLLWSASATYYVHGQNDDLDHQHRAGVFSNWQAELPVGDEFSLFAGAGLSALLVSKGDSRHYHLFAPFREAAIWLSPGTSLGVSLKGSRGELKTYLAYNSNIDAGFRQSAQQTHMFSINGEVWY